MFNLFKQKTIPIPPGGCEKSPDDPRDLLASQVSPVVKRWPEILLPPFDLEVLNQGQTPHCVGYTGALIKQERELLERISETFDGDWIYKKCKETDNWSGRGTFLRIGMKILQKQGAKTLKGNEQDALKYRIGAYALVDDMSFEGLKKAIFINRGLMAGFHGSNQGWQAAYIRPPREGENRWGHAVALVGYTKKHIIGINSWGDGWGDKGFFYVPENYMPFEAWEILVDYPTTQLPTNGNGFIAVVPGWITNNKIQVRLNLRREPRIDNNVIRTLPAGTNFEVVKWAGISDNYSWIEIKVA